MPFCHRCGTVLENYSREEGGWCPKCEEWYPYDIIRMYIDEAEG